VTCSGRGSGLDQAGVGGLAALGEVGMAADAASYESCDLGSAAGIWAQGHLSVVNQAAQSLGSSVGRSVKDAADALTRAAPPPQQMPPVAEARRTETLPSGLVVTLVDSASLVGAQDIGRVVITGSHGALIGGQAARAIKAAVRIAVYNDAGLGRNGIGITRLPALDAQGIAAVTVSDATARIGDAMSSLADGDISACNAVAGRQGAAVGMALSQWLESLPLD